MDVSVHCADPLKKDLIGRSDWVKLWSTCMRDRNAVDSLVAEFGSAFEDALVLLSSSAAPNLKACEVCLKKEKDCGNITESGDDCLISAQNELAEKAVSPCSELSSDAHPRDKDKILALDEPSLLELGDPTSAKSDPPRTPVKPFSAMKGSREKRGLQVGGLSVSWEPDVYDPPTSSQSHTVNGHTNQRYSMPNKKNHQQKHKHKGKSSRSSGNDRKQKRKSVSS